MFSPTACALLTNTTFFLSILYSKYQHPYSGYPSRSRKTETPIQQKLTSLPQNKRSGTSAHPVTFICRRRKYITFTRNRTIGKFTDNLFMIIQYFIVTYGKISSSQLVDLEQNTKFIQYDPQTPIGAVFNQAKYLL